jgi:OOP family OmpA-OmpF porin
MMLVTATSLEAQRADKGRDGFEFEAYAGVFYPKEPAFGAGEVQFTLDERQLTFGARLGWTFGFNLFLQAEGGYVPLTMEEEGGPARNINTLLYGGSLGYNLQFSPEAQLFLLVGGGIIHWDPDGLPQENQLRGHFGGGLRIFLTRGVALRFEARDHLVPKTLSETRGNLNPSLTINDELTHNIEISGGITLFFGVNRDDDKDRVFNEYDSCPATPGGAPADARGCPLDSDEDGVIDQIDQCSHTLPGTPVDQRGCPTDSDGDAPAGVHVDDTGCPVDADGDGVPDGLDRCPNTPADREVDEVGCTRIQAGIEAGRLVLSSIYFRTNSAELLAASRRVLNEVGQALLDRPEAQIEIQGHTDSSGSAGYNLQLSERRARAVFEYLVGTYPGLERRRFTVQGYGESRPIASNDTADGKAMNRRVEFVVRNP